MARTALDTPPAASADRTADPEAGRVRLPLALGLAALTVGAVAATPALIRNFTPAPETSFVYEDERPLATAAQTEALAARELLVHEAVIRTSEAFLQATPEGANLLRSVNDFGYAAPLSEYPPDLQALAIAKLGSLEAKNQIEQWAESTGTTLPQADPATIFNAVTRYKADDDLRALRLLTGEQPLPEPDMSSAVVAMYKRSAREGIARAVGIAAEMTSRSDVRYDAPWIDAIRDAAWEYMTAQTAAGGVERCWNGAPVAGIEASTVESSATSSYVVVAATANGTTVSTTTAAAGQPVTADSAPPSGYGPHDGVYRPDNAPALTLNAGC